MSRFSRPEEERIYPLKSLQVPPKKYDVFLHKVLDDYKQFILQETGCDTLEEAEEKERQRIIKLNPDKEPDDIRNYPAVVVSCYGITNPFIKIPFRPHDYFDVGLENAEKKISNFVSEVSTRLDKKFPKRSGKFPLVKSIIGEKFSFCMELSTWAFWRDFEVEAGLIDYGSIGLTDGYHIPAIHVKSSTLYGSKSLVRRSVERLEEIVMNQYENEIKEIRYISSYAKEL